MQLVEFQQKVEFHTEILFIVLVPENPAAVSRLWSDQRAVDLLILTR